MWPIPLPGVAFHSPWVPGRHEDRWVRLLYRLGHGPHALEMIVLALPVKYLCCPAFLDDLHRFSAPAQGRWSQPKPALIGGKIPPAPALKSTRPLERMSTIATSSAKRTECQSGSLNRSAPTSMLFVFM